MRCDAVPKQTSSPFTMMPMRPQSASHSSMLCVVRIADLPCIVAEMRLQRNRRDSGSTPVVGSSRNTMRGSPIRAMPGLRLKEGGSLQDVDWGGGGSPMVGPNLAQPDAGDALPKSGLGKVLINESIPDAQTHH